jgi:hypothetical protein
MKYRKYKPWREWERLQFRCLNRRCMEPLEYVYETEAEGYEAFKNGTVHCVQCNQYDIGIDAGLLNRLEGEQ